MAFARGDLTVAVGNKTANQSTLNGDVLAGTAAIGDLVVVAVAVDNHQTTDGDEGAVTSITDTGSNTYTKAVEFCNGNGSAQTGGTISIWYSVLTTAISVDTFDALTVNFSNNTSRDAAAIAAGEFTKGAGTTISVAGSSTLATDGADPGDITLGSLSSREYLWIWGLAAEGPNTDAYTYDADYTGIGTVGTTGGAAGSNIHLRHQYRIMTGTTDTVAISSDTADRDYAQALVAFYEVSSVAASKPFLQNRWNRWPRR